MVIPSNIIQVNDCSSANVLQKLTDFVDSILRTIIDNQPFSFSIPSRAKPYQLYDSNLNRYLLKNNMAIRLTSTFNSRRATNTLYVMEIILKLLEDGKRCTLRALYYK
ncbi:DNA topoisomerase type II (ATP-hydrolyzing) [Trifolium repens]|nr:DNA topoisomerase 6 subunit A [Trifolium repens]WJX13127.1 DNA topoisomerase type II (ATP-hydrolyzing) [Trifolium repens]